MRFHKQKLWFHRATMMHFAAHLKKSGRSVDYIEHQQRPLQSVVTALAEEGYTKLIVAELHDDLLERRLRSSCARVELALDVLSTPMFLNSQVQMLPIGKGRSGGLWLTSTSINVDA